MKELKYLTVLLSLFIFGLVVSGCSRHIDKNKLEYGSTKDIRDINPHLYNGEMGAQNMVFEGLVKDTKGKIEPALATKWTLSNDKTVYTFTIRKNVRFSNGEKLTAQVIKENFDAILANKERHEWMGLPDEIASTSAPSKYQFVLTLREPYYPTLTELSLTRPFRIIAPSCFKNNGTKDGVKGYVGTGPYVLADHKKNKEVVFKENKYYWGTKPHIATVNWHVISNTQSLYMALKKGDIQLIYGSDGDQISADTLKSLEKNGKFKVYMSKPNASRSILLNTNRGALRSLEVRKAVSYAINKKEIVSGVLDNSESMANTLLPPNAPYMKDLKLKKQHYDLEKANQLLEKAGWKKEKGSEYREKNGTPLTLTFSCNSQNAQEEPIAQVVQANLKKAGIKVKIISEDKQAYLNRQKDGDFDMQYSLSWGAPYDPQTYLASWRMAAHGDYQAQLGLPKKQWLDNEITEVLLASNKQERQEKYQQIMSYVTDEYVYVPVSFSKTKAVAVKQLKGIYFPTSQYEIPFSSMYFN